MSDIVDKIIANADEMFAAQKTTTRQMLEVDKQERYVASSADRCNRCGDVTFGFLPGAVQFCGECVALFQVLDMKDHGGEFWWFSKMLHQIAEGEKSNATQG